MLSHCAALAVPVSAVRTVSRWIAAHRRAHDARPWQRAATSRAQAIMPLRRLIEATDMTSSPVTRRYRPLPPTGTCTKSSTWSRPRPRICPTRYRT